MNGPRPISDRDRLLCAYACAEWSSALTHLLALRQVGCRVSDEVLMQVTDELTSFTAVWSAMSHQTWTVDKAVERARAWLTEHTDELDAVLAEHGVRR
jgi:hypothetical protein